MFDRPWPRFHLDDLRAFLATAGEEGDTWEAKADGRKPLHPDSVRRAGCGLANQIGGYVLVGAKWNRQELRWELPGIARPDPEPETWLGKVIRGLSPTPRHEARAWRLDGGRVAAVVRVEPVAEPPCMTRQGRVFIRVSGETLPVEDPALLERLFRNGRHARERAEQFAIRAARRALDAAEWRAERAVGITVALASVGRETDDIASRLFTPSFRTEVVQAATDRLVALHPTTNPTRWNRIEQDAFSYFVWFDEDHVLLPGGGAQRQHRTEWHLQATWDGAVAASMSFDEHALWHLPDFEELVRIAWREVALLVERLGGYGPAHMTVAIASVQPSGQVLYGSLPVETRMDRHVGVGEPSEEVIASLRREAGRAAGLISDEPEGDDGDTQETGRDER